MSAVTERPEALAEVPLRKLLRVYVTITVNRRRRLTRVHLPGIDLLSKHANTGFLDSHTGLK